MSLPMVNSTRSFLKNTFLDRCLSKLTITDGQNSFYEFCGQIVSYVSYSDGQKFKTFKGFS